MRKQTGFTLIELLIVLVIAGVLAGIAAPNLATFVKNNARSTRINSMVTALNVARSEAISKRSTVTLCAATINTVNINASNCNTGTGGQFAGGWMLFVENANSTIGVRNTGDTVFRIFQPNMGTATLKGADDTEGDLESVTYGSNGFGANVNGEPGVFDETLFTYCDDRGASEARGIALSPTGHPSSAAGPFTCP